MSRIINTQGSPATQRNRLRRAIAEALHRLESSAPPRQEGKDLSAMIVFALRAINESIEQSAEAWEKRDYYMKAERFRREWQWLGPMERLMTSALVYEQWKELPPLYGQLRSYLKDIEVNKLTRSSELWEGAYERLMAEQSGERGKL